MKSIFKIILLVYMVLNIVQADTFNSRDKNSWIDLLKNADHTILDSRLQTLYDNVQKDITKEEDLFFALSSFENSTVELGNMIEEWKKKKANSIFASTAWGIYNTNIAFLSRGTKFINKTTAKQLAKMKAYFREAKDVLTHVIKKDPKFTVAIKYLMMIDMAESSQKERRELLDRSLLVNPNSCLIRYEYLNQLQPKWGGSLELLKQFMKETTLLYDKNRALKKQEGFYEYVLSDMLRFEDNFNKDKQLEYLNEAIEKNPMNSFLYKRRGESYYYYQHDLQKAINDYMKSLDLFPQNSDALVMLAKIYLKKKEYDKALVFINRSLKYDGLDPSALRTRGKIYFEQNRMNESLASYQDSLIYASENVSAYTYIGYIYYRKKNYALTASSLLKADAIKPGSYNDWYIITAAQWHDRDCKFVGSAYKYQSKCKKSHNKCSKEKLDWVIKSAEYAKAKGICK